MDKLGAVYKDEYHKACGEIASLQSRLSRYESALRRIKAEIDSCSGKIRLPLVSQISAIAKAALDKVEGEK